MLPRVTDAHDLLLRTETASRSLASRPNGSGRPKEDVMSTTPPSSIRPFSANFSPEEIAELRRRIIATRWPEQETVTDASQGVKLATIQKLARYWGTDYDWRKCEAKLKALPQFVTEIDGLDIHFIHVRSKREDALPLIVTHGWPGSIIESSRSSSRSRTPPPTARAPTTRSTW